MSNIQHDPKRAWHNTDAEQAASDLNSDGAAGLSSEEAKKRLREHGKNELPKKKQQNRIIRFLKYFNDVLIYVLLAAAIVSLILGHYTDAIVIVIVAIVNACIGYIQESRAEDALKSIQNMLSLKAKVIRESKSVEINAEDVTIGDIVLLGAGDKIPADLRLIDTEKLRIEESALTGESEASDKNTEKVDKDTELGDRTCMAFTSTTVSVGTGKGIVVNIGKHTEIGKINQMMTEVENLTTPLLRQTSKFGKTVSIFTIIIAAATYVFGYFLRDYEMDELLMSVIGLAVAAIPEGLPAILSIILAIGVQNMARRKAIIRNLPSVETLGSVSVICSDKTGTLTKNEMTVKHVATREKQFSVSGTGYSPDGSIETDDDNDQAGIKDEPVLAELLRCFYVCNEASVEEDKNGDWSIKGDPTEAALITLFKKGKMENGDAGRLSTIPFDSEYKYMATLVKGGDENIIYIKGAPDRLLEMAEKEKHAEGEKEFDKKYWEDKISELANNGERIIGAAYKHAGGKENDLDHDDVQSGVIFLGLAGIIDPPRDEAVEAINQCKDAGITVKMITGDHADTAKAIGLEMGIGDGEHVLQGRDLQDMSDEDLKEAVMENDVFARTSPEHKLRLVNALQSGGVICAMTGDGVNDAPALKQADVGIAMGIKGTEVTKDASEMVLADDNFKTIVEAVKEGRRIYDNLKKTILFILPTNGAESFLIIASILFGTMMPLTPVQILWVNMVTSVTVSLALAFEKIEKDAMRRPPRPAKEPLLSGYFIWRILFVSVLMGGGTLALGIYLKDNGMEQEMVRTITLQTIVISQLFHLFNCRSIHAHAFSQDFFSNRAIYVVAVLLFILQSAITYLPFMNRIFGTVQLELAHWQYPFYLGIAVFVIVEIEKLIARKWMRKDAGGPQHR